MDFKELREKITERVLKTFDFSSVDELVKQNPNMKPSEALFKNIDYDEELDIVSFIINRMDEVIYDNLSDVVVLIQRTFPDEEYKRIFLKRDIPAEIRKLIVKKYPQFITQIENALENQCVQRAKVLLARKTTMKGTKTAVWGKKSHRDELASALSKNFRKML